MIKNFVDKTGSIFDFSLRGSYAYIKTAKQLKDILDYACSIEGIKKVHPSLSEKSIIKYHECLIKKSYHEIMLTFGMTSQSYYKGIKK
jgi:hypothetical protein